MKEVWKDIPGYEWLYQVSNMWNVKSFRRWFVSVMYKQETPKWYEQVTFSVDKNRKTISAHRLVMIAFRWPSDLQVNHKNWIKNDNRLENLEYCTQSENIKHSYRELNRKHFMRWKKWKDCAYSVKVDQYTKDWEFVMTHDSVRLAGEHIWIKWNHIWCVCLWKRKTAWWFIWEYHNK